MRAAPTSGSGTTRRIASTGVYDVRGEFSSATGASGLKLTVDQQALTAPVPQTDGWFKPVFVPFGALRFDRPGVYHVILEPADPAKWRAVNVYRLQVMNSMTVLAPAQAASAQADGAGQTGACWARSEQPWPMAW